MTHLPNSLRIRSIAALAVLQPGIAPVFLVMLTGATGISWEYHGWIAAADQLGMAAGALTQWHLGMRVARRHAVLAALAAAAIALAVVELHSITALLIARTLYGFCVGLIFNRAESNTVRIDPDRAFGTIFLIQLVLSTFVTTALPALAPHVGDAAAVRLLAVGPLLIALLLSGETNCDAVPRRGGALPMQRPAEPAGGVATWLMIAVMLLFIGATMMLWSYAGALGGNLALTSKEIGVAVAVGSGAGAITALAATFSKPRFLVTTGLACALAMTTPLLLDPWVAGGLPGNAGFILAMSLFNIGSTFAIIRFSAQAILRDPSDRGRRRVTALRCVAMVVGPMLGGAAVRSGGQAALAEVVAGALLLALLILLLVRRPGRPIRRRAAPTLAPRVRLHPVRRLHNHMEKPLPAMYGVREEAGDSRSAG